MKKRMTALLMAMMLALLAACGNSDKGMAQSNAGAEEKSEVFMDTLDSESAEAATEPEQGTGDSGGAAVQVTASDRKLIKQQEYSVETKAFTEFVDALEGVVADSGGYVEYSDISGEESEYGDYRYARYTLRIPADRLDNFKGKMKEMANVTHISEQVEDVTLDYVDTESHISALKTEQESLMAMLEKAETLEDIMLIQHELTEVRYQLESYESRKRTYDSRIQYSSIEMTVREVERETKVSDSFGAQLKERLIGNLYDVKEGFRSLALWLIGGLPYWILLAIMAAVGVFIVQKIKKTERKKAMNRQRFMQQNIQPEQVQSQVSQNSETAEAGKQENQK